MSISFSARELKKLSKFLLVFLLICTMVMAGLMWLYGVRFAKGERFTVDEARQMNSYLIPLDSPQDAVAFANSVDFFSEINLKAVQVENIWKPYIRVQKESLLQFAADAQEDYELGLLSRSEYLSKIGEAVPTAAYWQVSFRPKKRCILAIKPSGRILERWSKGCGFENYAQ